ncbi:tetratricopeptide repeat protein [Coprococcus catus]|uniref:tetratricopeptide repeat protein n=1 Tax=Coprococcus catus TaxID=116085 RepID=UPI001C8CF19B|nr:tetratricopeptide repeat protein [Coprococcus catus]MBX9230296.1 hypothetical protein [Coprococcus catus]MCT6798649.1 sel1 repeat family protein [Coprococcus catus]
MERYIYINYAYEDYRLVQRIIEDIEKTGVKVYHGSGSEERVAGSVCVIHFWTPAAHTSRSYRKVMNYTLKHELDTMLFHLDGVQMASELDVQLDVLHALFKYKYQMMSQKAKTADVAASVEVKSEAEAGAEELSIKPENVTIKAEAAAAVKSAEEPVEAAKSTAEEPMAKEARVRTENIDETQKKQLQQQETEKTAELLTTRDDLFAEGMRILETGTTREDGVKAFKYLRQAASQGHTEAQYQLSVCYDRGIGVRKSIIEAAKWCQMAAFGGHAKAQSEIGYCYEYGQGVVRNIKEAVSWYEMASAQGNIQAKNNLAFCYQKGRGVHKDVKEAIRLYEEAAAGGHASAQYNLGYCYWYGEGVKTDKNRAIELFKQSADNGNAKAAQMLKILSQHLFMK